jgi:hypothetical protein
VPVTRGEETGLQHVVGPKRLQQLMTMHVGGSRQYEVTAACPGKEVDSCNAI